jgi:hypothetical protein
MRRQDEISTPSTHISTDSSARLVSENVWVDGVLSSSVPSNSRFSASTIIIHAEKPTIIIPLSLLVSTRRAGRNSSESRAGTARCLASTPGAGVYLHLLINRQQCKFQIWSRRSPDRSQAEGYYRYREEPNFTLFGNGKQKYLFTLWKPFGNREYKYLHLLHSFVYTIMRVFNEELTLWIGFGKAEYK